MDIFQLHLQQKAVQAEKTELLNCSWDHICMIVVYFASEIKGKYWLPCAVIDTLWHSLKYNVFGKWEDEEFQFILINLWQLIKTSYTCSLQLKCENRAGILSCCLLYLYRFTPTNSTQLSVLLSSFWGRMWAESWPFGAHPSHINIHSRTDMHAKP